MNKLRSIYEGWKNYYKGKFCKIPEPLAEIFDDRLEICKPCEYNLANVCTRCGCFINKKTKSLTETCPENFWNPAIYDKDGTLIIFTSEIPPKLRQVAIDSGLFTNEEEILYEQWEEFLTWLVDAE